MIHSWHGWLAQKNTVQAYFLPGNFHIKTVFFPSIIFLCGIFTKIVKFYGQWKTEGGAWKISFFQFFAFSAEKCRGRHKNEKSFFIFRFFCLRIIMMALYVRNKLWKLYQQCYGDSIIARGRWMFLFFPAAIIFHLMVTTTLRSCSQHARITW